MTDLKKLRAAENLINRLMTGLPAAAEAIAAIQASGVTAEGLGLAEPLNATAQKLQEGLQAYEAWAESAGPWASR